MRRVKQKHTKTAYVAFIITLAIAILALYYAWTTTPGYGKTIAGLQNYACVQWLKENPGQTTCPQFTAIETQKEFCCCYNPESTSRFQGKMEVYVDVGQDPQASCAAKCAENARVLQNVGNCKWI